MTHLSIDIETFSSVDLKKCGVYRYAASSDFEVLIFSYAVDDQPIHIVDLAAGETIPHDVLAGLLDSSVVKSAFNANFERVCLSAWLATEMPPEQWRCTMVHCAMSGLPMSLDTASKALGLDALKDGAGKALIRFFCVPCKPTKANKGRTRNLWSDDLDRWNSFKKYCAQDVLVERCIARALAWFKVPEQEQELWSLDQHINDRGVKLDRRFIEMALSENTIYRNRLIEEAIQLTGLDNPNAVAKLSAWISEETDQEVNSLTKESVSNILHSLLGVEGSDTVQRVLTIRQELSKTSIKKYDAMMNAIGADDRVRGLFQFAGAGRTFRWSGKLLQPQNLPRMSDDMSKHIDVARGAVLNGVTEVCFGNVPDTLSQLIRTAFVAEKGSRFITCDFSAIEARVIAWLAGEDWVLDVFKGHGKIYEATAAQMFKVPVDSIKKGEPNYGLRAKGKVASLACGFGGGVNALIAMGAIKGGIPEEDLQGLVDGWRKANPRISALWSLVGNAAMSAVSSGRTVLVGGSGVASSMRIGMRNGNLLVRLPSGRCLCYFDARIRERGGVGSSGRGEALSYMGLNQITRKWERIDTWGGKLVENIVQGVARDCLAETLLRVRDAGYNVVMHVHDEVVCEMPVGVGSLAELREIMSREITWAKGLPLNAEGYECEYYKKD